MTVDEALRPWLDVLRDRIGTTPIVDMHTHLGADDPDGFRSTPDQLIAALERIDAAGVVFPMREPAGYSAANDRVLAAAREQPRRLAAFCRVDPQADAPAEAERCLEAGARGVKLHPRAEGFRLSHPAIAGVLALCAERGAPVLVHAGRGIPALGRDALALCERFPGAPIILAHAGISDLSWIWRRLDGRPGLLFDTSWWIAADLAALFALVPPGRIVFGSDTPYTTPLHGLVMTLRSALQAKLSVDQIASVIGGQGRRLLDWREPLDLGPAPGATAAGDVLLERVQSLLSIAMGRLIRHGEGAEELALARLACVVPDDAPQARVCRSILALLDDRDRLAEEHGEDGWVGSQQVATAALVARTPDVPVPEPPHEARAGP